MAEHWNDEPHSSGAADIVAGRHLRLADPVVYTGCTEKISTTDEATGIPAMQFRVLVGLAG